MNIVGYNFSYPSFFLIHSQYEKSKFLTFILAHFLGILSIYHLTLTSNPKNL